MRQRAQNQLFWDRVQPCAERAGRGTSARAWALELSLDAVLGCLSCSPHEAQGGLCPPAVLVGEVDTRWELRFSAVGGHWPCTTPVMSQALSLAVG